MALLCSTTCGTVTIQSIYGDGCTDVFRESGSNHLIFIKCGTVFVDFLDTAEWTTLIASNDIHISPAGVVEWAAPDITTANIEGCARDVEISRVYTVSYETYQSSLNGGDFHYWNQVDTDSRSYRVMLYSCDGLLYVDDEIADLYYGGDAALTGGTFTPNSTWVTAVATTGVGSPGFKFGFSTAPHEIHEGTSEELVRWGATMTIKKRGLMMAIPYAGLASILA